MLKAISYWSMENGLAGTHPIERALSQAKAAGFEGLELCIGTQGVLTPDTDQAACESIRQLVMDSGLVVETLASGMSWQYNPTSDNPDVREIAFAVHEAALHRAAWLGCKAMLFVPGVVCSPIFPGERIPYDVAVGRAREIVSRLLDVAVELEVDLCIENVWNGLFYSPLEFRDFIESFYSKRLGSYLDVGNLLGYQQYPPHWIELLDNHVKRVHIKDFRESFDWNGSYSFCRLGEGDVPWKETITSLRSIEYDGTIVAEMLPYQNGLLEETSKTMDELLKVVQK